MGGPEVKRAAAVRPCTRLAGSRLAPNPGPMTLDGTNSYVLAAPGASSVVVVDPGPLDGRHLADLAARPVALVLITHHHLDHTEAGAAFHASTGAPVRALDPAFCIGGAPLTDGELIVAAGVRIRVVATPGHTADSVCFLLPDDGPLNDGPLRDGPLNDGPLRDAPLRGAPLDGRVGAGSVLTGDTVLGRGTTVIAHPDGALDAYLTSLDVLAGLGPAIVLPAHGPVMPDLSVVVREYTAHRRARLAQVEAALRDLGPAADTCAITDVVYADIDPSVRAAAERSVAAQLSYLRSR